MRQGAFAIHFVVVPAAGIYHLMRLTVYLVFVNVFTVSGALPFMNSPEYCLPFPHLIVPRPLGWPLVASP